MDGKRLRWSIDPLLLPRAHNQVAYVVIDGRPRRHLSFFPDMLVFEQFAGALESSGTTRGCLHFVHYLNGLEDACTLRPRREGYYVHVRGSMLNPHRFSSGLSLQIRCIMLLTITRWDPVWAGKAAG